ncbi:hypothetical protein [Streptomyces luteogriseus]|uniref:hypothetical protein n=1 Tax=Streptomyces luteogriseus TaxID=68233 RepID=UPI0037A1A552
MTTALLLTACGSGDGKSSGNDRIAGTGQEARAPKGPSEPSATSAEAKPDGADVSLPKDMHLVFDWDKPRGKNEAAAMDDDTSGLSTGALTNAQPRKRH